MWTRAAPLLRVRTPSCARRIVRRPWSSSAAKPGEQAEGAAEGTVIGRVTEAVSEKVEAVGEKMEAVAEPVLEPLRDIFSLYSHALQEYPLRTNAATAAVLGAAGDFAAQVCEWRVRRDR